MKYINENKLNTEERNALPKLVFGLPSERKYPLNDENHIRKAVQFFKYCPKDKKEELAKNINNRALHFKMKMKISKDSLFYEHANPDIILQENSYIDNFIIKANKYNYTIDKISESYNDIYINNMKDTSSNYFTELKYNINLNDDINISLLEDLCNYTISLCNKGTYSEDIIETITSIDCSKEIKMLYLYELNISLINMKHEKVLDIETLKFKTLPIDQQLIYDDSIYKTTVSSMVNIKNKIEYDLKCLDSLNDQLSFYDVDIDNSDLSLNIREIIRLISSNIVPNYITKYNKNYSLIMSGKNLIDLKNLRGICDKIFTMPDINNKNVLYLGYTNSKLYLIGDHFDEFILICLYDENYKDYSENAYKNLTISDYKSDLIILHHKIENKKDFQYNTMENMLEITTEGIDIDKDGNVTFTLKPKTTYMNEYDKIHKELAINFESGNMEGVKTNLAYLFTMVISIEREYMHNKKKKYTEQEKEDPIKARRFAINDFKTYIRKLISVEPNFNFTKYYESNNYDKLSFTLSREMILGIRKLFQLIMMGN